MTTPNNNSNRELRDDELDAVTGGLVVISIIAHLLPLPPSLPFPPSLPPLPPPPSPPPPPLPASI